MIIFKRHHTLPSNQGFSLIELLVVISLTGLMAIIAIPNFTNFMYRQNLSGSKREIYQAIREAQNQSLRRKEPWQASIQEFNDEVLWAVHPAMNPSSDPRWDSIQWHKLDRNIDLSTDYNNSTVPMTGDPNTFNPIYQFTFDHNGHYVGDADTTYQQAPTITPDYIDILPEISLKLSSNVDSVGYAKGCVKIATVLGSMKIQKDDYCQ